MPNDKELLQKAFDFFSQYIKINEIGQDELQSEAEIILNAIEARLAQPEPEPYAILNSNGKETPLYTAPPKKEWVGLTDDELTDIRSKVQKYTPMDSVEYGLAIQCAMEEKLKEKNGMD